jgi:signal peptidase I
MRINRQRVLVGSVIVFLCTVAVVYGFVRGSAGVYRMPVSVMEPTIEVGETVWADMSAYQSADPQRWDVVVFRAPENADRSWVFRVVGMPGETISFAEGGLLIDGKPADLPSRLADITYNALAAGPGALDDPFVIPEDSYYVLGDNPAKANDSRVWGAVEREEILGKVNDR